MGRLKRILLAGVSIIALVGTAPVLWALLSQPAPLGYYELPDTHCACGHAMFVRITPTGYSWYSPNHHHSSHRHVLQPVTEGWIANEGSTNSFSLRAENGVVFRSDPSSTNWVALNRVYNLWRVWIREAVGD